MLSPAALMLIFFVLGAMLGLAFSSKRLGCLSLALIPLGGFAYVDWWQGQNLEMLRSTSGLDYLFVQFPVLIGGFAGYALVAFIREWRA